MHLRIHVPESATGDVMSDLNSRRARVQGHGARRGGSTTISAEGPLAEFLHYATDLRSMTGGRGGFEFEFARYDPVPDHVAQKVVEASKQAVNAAAASASDARDSAQQVFRSYPARTTPQTRSPGQPGSNTAAAAASASPAATARIPIGAPARDAARRPIATRCRRSP